MYKQCEQEDENVLMMEHENCAGGERLAGPDELSFTWFLMKVIQQIRKLCPPNYALLKRESLSYYAQLLLVFIMFIVAIVIGAVFLNHCYDEKMICIFLIVHGVCGIVVVLIHMTAAFVGRRSALLENRYLAVKCTFAFAHSMVVFCIIWFILGHIWIFKKTVASGYANASCMTNASQATILILIFEYMIGIWYLCARIWSSPLVLHWFQQIIQRRLSEFSNDQVPQLRLLENTDASSNEIDELHVALEPSSDNNNITLSSQFTKIHAIFLFIGLIILVISLGMMITLYVNLSGKMTGLHKKREY